VKILVAGIGNIFLGDDAFGCEVARQLTTESWPENVRIVDFGIRGFDLAYAILDGYDATILVDATPRGDAPGTLYTIEPDLSELDALDVEAIPETHGMNPVKVLKLVKALGGEFRQVLLVGCEPATFGPEEGLMGLSPEVQAAVPAAVQIVKSLIERMERESWAEDTNDLKDMKDAHIQVAVDS
jgi:hydrogenase maturation protease